MPAILRLLRPHHYVKNLLIFAPLFFAAKAGNADLLKDAALAFVAFCCLASAGYALNDVIDAEKDRLHAQKKNRPVASGEVSTGVALAVALALVIAAAALALRLPAMIPALVGYGALTAAYSLWLKRVPLVEIMAFGGFYLFRIQAGGAATGLPLSPWFTLTVLFLSFFMISAKRYAERAGGRERETLKAYPEAFLNALLIISATLMLMTYALYTILGAVHPLAIYSTLFAFFGALRYLQLIYGGTSAEFPERLAVTDPWLLATTALWAGYMSFIFYS